MRAKQLRYFMILLPLVIWNAAANADDIDQCWESTHSHLAAVECLNDIKEEAEEELALLLMHESKAAASYDRTWQEAERMLYARAEEYLEQSQSAFRHFMKEECTRRMVRYGAGNFAGDVRMQCEINMIRQRIDMLRANSTTGLEEVAQ